MLGRQAGCQNPVGDQLRGKQRMRLSMVVEAQVMEVALMTAIYRIFTPSLSLSFPHTTMAFGALPDAECYHKSLTWI